MQSYIKIFALAALVCSADLAQAGELFGNSQRMRQSQQSVQPRRIYQSTRSSQLLDRNRSNLNQQVLGFNQSSPYEYRISAYDKALTKYQMDYARWQTNVLTLQNREEQRKIREKINFEQRAKQQKERETRLAAKEQARLSKLRARDASGKSGSIFGRAFGSTEKEGPQDEKVKKAESFFGNVEEPTTTAVAAPQQKLSFWQRLKRAMFGG